MESNVEGNLLEVMGLARTLRQEQLFIQHEQTAFTGLIENLAKNSSAITKLAYICAQQRQNLNDLIIARPDVSPASCCRRAGNFETAKFVDAKKLMDYEHVIAYEEFFNHLYRSPYLLAISLSIGDRISEISQQHVGCVIHTLMTALYGNAINTRDVEMILKLLRELIEIQIVASDSPRHMLRANSSAFARLYHRLNETLFSAKIFLTAALFEPIMKVLVGSEIPLDVDPNKVIQSFTTKERFKRFGDESSDDYEENVKKFHSDTIAQLYTFAKGFVDSLIGNWSLFPSTLRWLVQTICHHLKQAHFSEKIINEILTDMVFTHFICPAVVSPDIAGIIDAPISENVRSNLIQIGQIIQMLALSKHENVESKFTEIYAKFESNAVTNLIDLLLVSRTGGDVVAILSQQSDFERAHLLSTQTELNYLVEFFKILLASDEFDVPVEDREKLKKNLSHLPDGGERHPVNGYDIGAFFAAGGGTDAISSIQSAKDRPKQGLLHIGKATKNKIAHCISFNSNGDTTNAGGSSLTNGNLSHCNNQAATAASSVEASATWSNLAPASTVDGSANSSPVRTLATGHNSSESEPILIFNLYNSGDNKLRPLTEEEVIKMNSIGQEMSNGDAALGVDGESCNLESTIDKSSIANAFDGIDGMSDDVMRPLHAKQTRFSISHDDGSNGNSDILEAVSEAPSNHSVTSSLELEENDQNDNLSDMVSANVSGRGTPNISGRDTPSSQVTDGGSINNALPTPQMQKLLSKARSDIDDKFCKFEIKKLIEGDETVSIISDTWSTDVLASDSENLDTSERERDRNFSTPLIPSAVVLPGDNNFDVLSGSGAGRATYLDASDQRSESNWSTDVLASDSEKVDTDDNLSLTARSDITDASGRLEGDRERLEDAVATEERTDAANCPDRRGDDHLSCCERGDDNNCDDMNYNCYGNSPASGAPRRDDSPRSVGGNDSDRSQEDSAFFDAVNSYEDASGLLSAAANISDDVTGSNLSSAASLHYQRLTTMARSSNRAPSGARNEENSFQQNYKNASRETGDFAVKQQMRRQTSAESIISNQSLTIDEAATTTVVSSTGTGIGIGIGHGLGIGSVAKTTATTKTAGHHHGKATMKKRNNGQNAPAKQTIKQCNEQSKDLIEFSDSGDVETMSPTSLIRDGSECSTERPLLDVGTDDAVVCRRLSTEQRATAFDGRRNGMLEVRPHVNSAPPLRRHQSLNYENHEIINASAPKRVSVIPSLKSYAQTDDYKNNQQQTQQQQQQQQQKQQEQQQEMLLVVKTRELHLNEPASGVADDGSGGGASLATITNGVALTAEASVGADVNVAMPANHRPTKSTGAIPKSISFDSSADKNTASSNSIRSSLNRTQRLNNDAGAGSLRQFNATGGNSSIFNKLKQGFFRHRRNNKSSARHGGVNVATDDFATTIGSGGGRIVSFSNTTTDGSVDLLSGVTSSSAAVGGGVRSAAIAGTYSDISDDILAKYRRKVSTSSETTNSDSTGNIFHVISKNTDDDVGGGDAPNAMHSDKTILYTMIKKKIRTVLSRTDLHTDDYRHTTYSNDTPLLAYLHVQLAQAMNLKNFQQISYVSEAIRCLSTLESGQQQKLLKELQHDIQKRQNYLQYLMRYHQNLLMIMENIKQFEMRLQTESITCNRYLMGACVRLFLEKRESKIEAFQQEFAHINVSDDKIDLIEEFIDDLMEELLSTGGMLNGMPEWQATEARLSIERILLRRMYHQVMFPNEDADLSRDTVLSDHIRKLQKIIHPSHPALCIAQEYLAEAPWTFAQQQLSHISAYNTPREKLQCVVRCISSIMSLLHMSSGRVPAADDLLPVLIYVVIMANPPYLLSTIEYISCFLGDKLEGEAQFHWTIFGSVVKFIKTMDYLD